MGREFIDLFDKWAHSYDETVRGQDEYHEVFADYEKILNKVCELSSGTVLEFGVGTGNLTEKLLARGHRVIGVEPSKVMRSKAKKKNPHVTIYDGDFLNFPEPDEKPDTIASTYAFHHLTDEEKGKALGKYHELLAKGGKIVLADTAFADEEERLTMIRRVKRQGYNKLLADLKTEYYPNVPVLCRLFTENGFTVSTERLNRYVWLFHGIKIDESKKGL